MTVPLSRRSTPPGVRTDVHDLAVAVNDPWVVRDRLLARLVAPTGSPVVVVTGAAGSGKSTLATQWTQCDPRPFVVVRAASHLDDPATLARHLLDALDELGASTREVSAVATGTEPGFSAVLLPALTTVTSSRSGPFLLIVDDIHLLHAPGCHQVLAALCDGVPAESTLALLSRETPAPWLARTRAEGRLHEIRPDDLALDLGEARALFDRVGASPDTATVAMAVERNEGWAVGLYLTALAEREGRLTGDGALDTGRYIDDYLHSEVLGPLEPEVLEFMRRTSVLEELTPGLCEAVTGRPDAAHVLRQLHRDSQLVVQTDVDAYRYHHLLADVLRTDLRELEPAEEPVLHQRASRWYAEHDDLTAAIRHAKLAGDLETTGALVWSGIVECIGSGRPDQLQSWLADLSDRQLASERWLTLAAAWSGLQGGDFPRATRWLLAAQAHVGPEWRAEMARDAYAAQLAVPYSLIGTTGLHDTIAACDAGLAGMAADDRFRPPAYFLRGVALVLLRDLEAGLASMRQAESVARALDVPLIVADSLAFQGMVAMIAGDRERASTLISGGTDIIRQHHLERLATAAHTMTAQALMLAIRHEEPEARAMLATARRMTVAAGGLTQWFQVLGRLIQARTAILLGDGATARVLVTEAKAYLTPELQQSLVQDLMADTEAALATMTSGAGARALTSAELRVLAFLPSHLSFPQIGEHLFLSQNTVKTHALSIYRKFGVSSRKDAVETARELGLVEPAARV